MEDRSNVLLSRSQGIASVMWEVLPEQRDEELAKKDVGGQGIESSNPAFSSCVGERLEIVGTVRKEGR